MNQTDNDEAGKGERGKRDGTFGIKLQGVKVVRIRTKE